jgi:carbon monoxide dehydrogenase subunit G
MRLTGDRRFLAPRAMVFVAIHDPAVLLACIPGCEAVEQVAPEEYRARIVIRLPGIAGAWALNVRVADAVPPARCRLEGRIEGTSGTVAGEARLELEDEPDGGSRLDYVAAARIEGPLAWLDTALIERLARTILDQGLARLDQEVGRRADGDAGATSNEVGVAT